MNGGGAGSGAGGFAGPAGAAIAGGTPDSTGINAGQPVASIPKIEDKPKRKHADKAASRYGKKVAVRGK